MLSNGDPSNSELRAALFAALSPELAGHGFSLKPAQSRFVRRRGDVSDLFVLVCLDGKPGLRIQPEAGVRLESVEDLFHRTSGFEPKHQKHTATMGSSVRNLLSGDSRRFEFRLERGDEVDPIARAVTEVFREVALPYFEQWGSIKAIDAELNLDPGKRTPHRSLAWFRCSTAIIVARLLGRADYDRLAATYTEVMTRDNQGFYLKYFQALVKSLDSVGPRSDEPAA